MAGQTVRDGLTGLIAEFGWDLARDGKVLEAHLVDLCPESRREIVLLSNAYREGVPRDLMSSDSSDPAVMLRGRLVKRLQANLFVTADVARWIVETWSIALGLMAPADATTGVLPSAPPISDRNREAGDGVEGLGAEGVEQRRLDDLKRADEERATVLRETAKAKRLRAFGAVVLALVCFAIGWRAKPTPAPAPVPQPAAAVDITALPSSRLLAASDLTGDSPFDLNILKSAPYARHGLIFTDPVVNWYFLQYPWYDPTTLDYEGVSKSFTDIESANVRFVAAYRAAPAADITALPSQRLLTDADLAGKTSFDLIVIQDSPYARHGFIFTDPDLNRYFLPYSWYTPTSSNYETVSHAFSHIETMNVNFVASYRQALNAPLPQTTGGSTTP